MRFSCLVCLLFWVVGLAAAQQTYPEQTTTNFSSGPQYMVNTPNPQFLQPLETPHASPTQQMGTTSPQSGQTEPITVPGVPGPANLPQIYWGNWYSGDWEQPPMPEGEEVTAPESEYARPLPPGFFDAGVTAMTTDRILREEGYGMTVAEAARYWKAHKTPVAHVYTNKDIERLPRG
jgi:hypothetical protein